MLLSVLESTKCLLELQTGKTLRLLLQSDLGLHCLSRLNWEATGVRNSRTFTIPHTCREHSGSVVECLTGKGWFGVRASLASLRFVLEQDTFILA